MRRGRSRWWRQQATDPAAETGLSDAGNNGGQTDAADAVRVARSSPVRVQIGEKGAIQRGRGCYRVFLGFAGERVTLQDPGGPRSSHHHSEDRRIEFRFTF